MSSNNDSLAAPLDQQPVSPQPGGRTATSVLAILGLIFGILSVFFWILVALPGLICSIIALVKIRGSKGALTGKGMAIAGLVLSAFFLVIYPLMLAGPLMGARASALHVASTSNMSCIGKACFQYASPAYKNQPPASLDDLFKEGLLDNEKVITNPLTQEKSYIFLPYDKKAPGMQIILAEGPGSAEDSINMLFVDGHVKAFKIKGKDEQERFVRALRANDREELLRWRGQLGEAFYIKGDTR